MSLLEFKRLDYDFSEELTEAFMKLRGHWETPNDWPIMDTVSLWRHGRELACGYYYRCNPRPPKHWFYAYRAWASYVRQVIHNKRLGLDTEAQVAKACADGRLAPDLYQAVSDARYLEDTTGQPQKLIGENKWKAFLRK